MRKGWLTLLLTLLLTFPALGEEEPAWEYPLSPEIIANREGYITLTNRAALLSEDYAPEDLVKVTLKRVVQGELRKAAHDALGELFQAAQAEGHTLYVKSAYRSYKTQKTMYFTRLEKQGRDDGWVAYPGSSDHQTGLGVDVLNYEWTKKDGMNVSDGSSEDMPAQRRVVEQVLAEIGAEGQPRLDVINKCDIAPREEEPLPRIPGALPISAKTGAGLDALLAAIAQRLRGQETEVTLLIPFARHGIISELRAKGRVTEERYEENGTRVRALLKREALGQITARYGDLIVPEQEEAR